MKIIFKGARPSGVIAIQGGPPWNAGLDLRYLEEFSELSKILPDLEFSAGGLLEVSRVLHNSVSSRRNLCSKLDIWLRSEHFGWLL